jgi:hypothetical protein
MAFIRPTKVSRTICSDFPAFGVFDAGTMERLRRFCLCLALSVGALSAQFPIPRANAEIDAAGIFPVGGYVAGAYSSGPGLRMAVECRLTRYLAADAGWTAAWMATDYSCSRFGCSYSRLQNKFLDYGLRGVLPLDGGRVELSVGVGGAYIWFDPISDDHYHNGPLFQYSGKAVVALDRTGRWRVNFTVRTYRDLGSPIQQWLSTSAGISYGFGTVR